MSQLEHRLRDSELQVHGALLGRGAPYGDVCLLRLQVGTRTHVQTHTHLYMHTHM